MQKKLSEGEMQVTLAGTMREKAAKVLDDTAKITEQVRAALAARASAHPELAKKEQGAPAKSQKSKDAPKDASKQSNSAETGQGHEEEEEDLLPGINSFKVLAECPISIVMLCQIHGSQVY